MKMPFRARFSCRALANYPIFTRRSEEIDDGIWSIYFCDVLLGRVDERDYIIRT